METTPVESLTEIMLDCYELLSTISTNYKPTGKSHQDRSVENLRKIFESWPESHIKEIRDEMEEVQRVSGRGKRSSMVPPPPLQPSVQELEDQMEELEVETTEQSSSEKITSPNNSQVVPPRKTSERDIKNNEYFMKLKEDEALARKKREEEEAKMKPEELQKLREERRAAEEHDKSKTAHLSNLGSKYMPNMKKNANGELIIEKGGGGGRGRGRGRGN